MPARYISILGAGYVGLCTAVAFASKGYKVIVATHSTEKATSINEGIPPFYEPGLKEPLGNSVNKGLLECVTDPKEAVEKTNITLITVGTPSHMDGSVNLRYIETSSREIGEALNKKGIYHLVVVKSTVLPGTSENVVKPTIEKQSNKVCGVDFGLCMSPEFLREGSAMWNVLNPDHIIIGEYDEESGNALEALYEEFYKKPPPIMRTNLPTAELVKYANNAFLATKISFINTIANICERIPGTDVNNVAKGMGLDNRIAPTFLNAGLGYGGSCLPKDVKALIAFSKSLSYDPALLIAVESVNNAQSNKVVEFAKKYFGDLQGKRIAILGLAFKPNTNDTREASSIKIIKKLLKEGARIVAYDPVAIPNTRSIFKDSIEYARSPILCLRDADLCIINTEWDEFAQLSPEDFIRHMKTPLIIDGRRICDPEQFSRRLKFIAVGLSDYMNYPKAEKELN